jgi:glucose/arabinose dehydrogenase
VLHHHFVKAAGRRSRFQLAAVVTALALIGGAGPAAGSATRPAGDAAGAPAAFNPLAFNLVRTAVVTRGSGLESPVLVTHAGDGSGRLFVVEQTGKIRVIKDGVLLSTPFINFSASILTTGEQGLLGLAFHPQFETNGKFYVYMTLRTGNNAVNEYRAVGSADTVDWRTGRRIMTISHPTYTNHNGGNLVFGPDGHLYIGTGDGGGSGDPFNRAQNINSFLGKMLRINPNLPNAAGTRNYRIPQTNPYVGRTGLDEIWARGLRNPWRYSFDRVTGDLWIGDVGQNRWEEIDRSRAISGLNAGRGANYGWRIMEGRACFNPSRCTAIGVRPIAVYSHSLGCSVTGGYVSRGPDPLLAGGYLYGDFCSGRIWGLDAAAASPTAALLEDTDLMISSFGEDEAGNLYVVDLGGSIWRLSATAK